MIKTLDPQLSFVLSALAHLFIFSNLIVIFFIPSAPRQPEFLFLGSILQKTDVREEGATLQPPHLKNLFAVHPIEKVHDIRESSSLTKSPLIKPSFPDGGSPNEKRTLKSGFPPPEGNAVPQGQEMKKLDIPMEAVPYMPLRLKRND